jgi:hypothetical protein
VTAAGPPASLPGRHGRRSYPCHGDSPHWVVLVEALPRPTMAVSASHRCRGRGLHCEEREVWRRDRRGGRRPAVWARGETLIIGWDTLARVHVLCRCWPGRGTGSSDLNRPGFGGGNDPNDVARVRRRCDRHVPLAGDISGPSLDDRTYCLPHRSTRSAPAPSIEHDRH